MSYSKYQPTYLSDKAKEKALLNSIFTSHDLCCGCPDPPTHLLHLIAPIVKPEHLNKEEKATIRKCLSGIIEEEDPTGEDGFAPGDLEQLFADDVGENDG